MIRLLKISELPLAYNLGLKFFKEGNIFGKLKKDTFISTWTNLISKKIGTIFGLFRDNTLIGMIGGVAFPDPNDGELVVTEMFWYMDKQYRGVGGIKLFKAFKKWAKAINAKRVIMVHLTGLMPKKLEQFYKKQGFSPIETHYIKEI